MTGPYYATESVVLHLGDCLKVLATLPDASVDAVVTDPPYGLEFMGKEWDKFGRDTGNGYRETPRMTAGRVGGYRNRETPNHFEAGRPYQQWCTLWAAECLRVLKPGGHLLAFGGTRTYHRLACAIEDAGFEIRDSLHWIYGSGFPKSLDVSKAIDKAAGAQREVAGLSPYSANRAPVVGNAETICRDGGDIPAEPERLITAPATEDAAHWDGWGTALKPAHEPIVLARKPLAGTVAQNVLAHGTGALNVDGCRVANGTPIETARGTRRSGGIMGASEMNDGPRWTSGHEGRWPPNVLLGPEAAEELDRQSGVLTSGANPARRASDKFRDAYGEFTGQTECIQHRGVDVGGASRFFPVFRYQAKASSKERPRLPDDTAHPTVKPVALMCWLVRLVTPPGGLVLDPFAGTGTTGEACLHEGFRCVLIEQDATSAALARQRLSKSTQGALEF